MINLIKAYFYLIYVAFLTVSELGYVNNSLKGYFLELSKVPNKDKSQLIKKIKYKVIIFPVLVLILTREYGKLVNITFNKTNKLQIVLFTALGMLHDTLLDDFHISTERLNQLVYSPKDFQHVSQEENLTIKIYKNFLKMIGEDLWNNIKKEVLLIHQAQIDSFLGKINSLESLNGKGLTFLVVLKIFNPEISLEEIDKMRIYSIWLQLMDDYGDIQEDNFTNEKTIFNESNISAKTIANNYKEIVFKNIMQMSYNSKLKEKFLFHSYVLLNMYQVYYSKIIYKHRKLAKLAQKNILYSLILLMISTIYTLKDIINFDVE